MIYRIFSLIIGYFIGNISPSYIVGKIHKIDIRTVGSGNAGTTNILRTFGKKDAAIVFLCDAFKGALACIVCKIIFGQSNTELSYVYMLYAAIGVSLGHCFPVFLQFKGGKAVASSFGAFLIIDYRACLISLAVFIILVLITKYISVGSIFGSVSIFICWMIFWITGINKLSTSICIETSILVFIISLLILIKHGTNMKRLINGTENKLGTKKG